MDKLTKVLLLLAILTGINCQLLAQATICQPAVEFTNQDELIIHQKARKRLFWTKTMRNIPTFAALTVTFGSFYFIDPYLPQIKKYKAAKLAGYFVSPFLLANLFADSIKQGISEAHQYTLSLLQGGGSLKIVDKELEYHKIIVMYEMVKDRLSADQIEYIDQKLRIIRQRHINGFGNSQTLAQDSDNKMNATLKAIETVIKLPNCKKELQLTETVSKKIDSMLENFSNKVKYDVKLSAFNMIASSTNSEQFFNQKKKQILYFLGPPGTGKTTLARKYAKSLNLPLIEISLAGVKIEDLNGERLYQIASGEIEFKKLSLLTSALINYKNENGERYRNAIIFIDEVDKALNSNDWEAKALKAFLLKLLDPDATKLILSDIGFEYDMSGHTFILAGNRPIKNQELRSRMKTVSFSAFDNMARISIAKNYFLEKMKALELIYTYEHLELVDKIAIFDPNPGVRSLLYVLDDFVNHLSGVNRGWLNANEFAYKEVFERYSPGDESDTSLDEDQMMFAKAIGQSVKKSLEKEEDNTSK